MLPASYPVRKYYKTPQQVLNMRWVQLGIWTGSDALQTPMSLFKYDTAGGLSSIKRSD